MFNFGKEFENSTAEESVVEAEKVTESPAKHEEDPTVLPSVDEWAASVVIPFLDLMDIKDVSERRKALLAHEKGKNEESIVSILNMADGYLNLVGAYYDITAPDNVDAKSSISVYKAKAQAMKAWLGI